MKTDRADIVHGTRRVVAITIRASVTAANGVANAATGVAAPRRVQTSLVVIVVVIVVARGAVIVARRARSARTIARRPASHIVGHSRDARASSCARRRREDDGCRRIIVIIHHLFRPHAPTTLDRPSTETRFVNAPRRRERARPTRARPLARERARPKASWPRRETPRRRRP